jgi:hypothetical protein
LALGPLIAAPGIGRVRLALLPFAIAATVTFVLSAVVAPGAGAAGQAVRLRGVTASIAKRTPEGSGTAATGRRSIPLLSPNPAKLRRAKARAARRAALGGTLSPQRLSPQLSPLPRAAVFGGLNSAGMFADEFSGTPPDTTGAIGPSQYVEFVNSIGITAYDRSTLSPVAGPVSLGEFIRFPTDNVFDPQIQWDQSWGRWIYAMDDVEEIEIGPEEFEVTNFLAFGWSKNADPTNLSTEFPGEGLGAGWCEHFLETGPQLNDYPKLGHGNSGITIGANVFDDATEEFVSARIWSIAKPTSPETCPEFGEEGLTAGAFGSAAEPLETADGDIVFTPVPANNADSSPNSYVVAADFFAFSSDPQIMAWQIEGGGAGATLVEDGNIDVSPFDVPANVPQPGTKEVIDSSDTRLTNAVAATDPAAGQEAVWTQHTVNGPLGRSAVRWYELLPETHTLRQKETISDPNQFVFNAAISPTAQGDAAAIDFNRGSETLFPEMHAQSREAGTPLGQMAKDILLGTSTGPAVDFSCNKAKGEPCRWGDYAGASPDPSVPGVVWGSNQGLAKPIVGEEENARWTTRNFALSTGAAPSSAPSTPPALPVPPIAGVNPPEEPPRPGVATVATRALVKGGKALLHMRCSGPGPCRGTVRLVVRVAAGEGRRGTKRALSLVIGKAAFSIPAGTAKVVAVRLTSKGKALLRKAGSTALLARVQGSGVKIGTVKLKAKKPAA